MAFLKVATGSKASRVIISFRSIANITTFSVPHLAFLNVNTQPERRIDLDLVIDGTTYSIQLEIEDETYHSRDFLGRLKKPPTERDVSLIRPDEPV